MDTSSLQDPKTQSYANESGSISVKRVNILVVDDLSETLLIYKTFLADMGHNLVTAQSGEEALKLISKQEFAVILLDTDMPGMDGFETATLIRQCKNSAHTPIIFLTDVSDEVQIAQGYASGAVDYLFTPVVPDILKAKIRVFVDLFVMRQQAALQAEERARRVAAEEADRLKDEFLGMLAHELRNPLGPILNGVQLLEMIGPKEPRLQDLRQMMGRQVTHMVRLIDDLLDSTRLAKGKILLRKECCNLADIVRQTTDDYRSIFDESGIDLLVETTDEPVWVNGDPTRLTQVVGNLLHNAHKFTNKGGRVTVKIKSEASGQARINVQDTGIGIDSTILPHIFDIFRQAEQGLDRNRGGLGLGLTLVEGLVKLHDGKVTVYSDGPGKGASFTIQIPTSAPAAVETPSITDQAAKFKRQRILVIEDNYDAATSLGSLLSLEGHDIRIVHNGVDGLEVAQEFQPTIILCDIGLPRMNGYQFMRTLKKAKGLQKFHAIATSGYGRESDIRLANEAGFDHHLTKPLDHKHLCRLIADLAVSVAPAPVLDPK